MPQPSKLQGVIAEPQLSVVAFRFIRAGVGTEELNTLNRQFLERINARRRVFLTSTMLGDKFVIRICILSFRTHHDRVQAALEDIQSALADIP